MLRAAIEADAELRSALPRSAGSEILAPVRSRRDGMAIDLFATITTVGTPLDITLRELRIETLFPATDAAREALARIRAWDDA